MAVRICQSEPSGPPRLEFRTKYEGEKYWGMINVSVNEEWIPALVKNLTDIGVFQVNKLKPCDGGNDVFRLLRCRENSPSMAGMTCFDY